MQTVFVNISLKALTGNESISREIKITLLTFFFLEVALFIVLLSYLPLYLKKLLSGVGDIVNDIGKGNYSLELNLDKYRQNYDQELVELVESVGKMLGIILQFDKMKKEKILEQKGRISALINMAENGFIIVNKRGDLILVNQYIEYNFPSLRPETNILDSNYGHEEDKYIKNFVHDIISTESRINKRQFFVNSMKRHIILKSELVRDTNGYLIGAVIGVFNIENKPGREAN
jgi:hypothetical protein